MKMKTSFTIKSLFVAGLCALSVSCNRQTITEDTSTITNDDNSAENAFYDMKTASDAAGTDATSSEKSIEKGFKKDSCVTVKLVDFGLPCN